MDKMTFQVKSSHCEKQAVNCVFIICVHAIQTFGDCMFYTNCMIYIIASPLFKKKDLHTRSLLMTVSMNI